jgi:hypothetical protein
LSIENILITNIDILTLRLSTYSNKELVDSFKKDFSIINDYIPLGEIDRLHIIEYQKAYVDEFKFRIEKDLATQIIEFANLLKVLMKDDKTVGDTLYTRNLVRLYSHAIKKLQSSGVTDAFMRREFL